MSYNEHVFKAKIGQTLIEIKKILDNTRNPVLAEEVPHVYDDKYILAEFATNTGIAAILNTLEYLGLDSNNLKQLKAWSDKRSVSLRFSAEHKCQFDRTEVKDVVDPTKHVSTNTFIGTTTHSTVRTVTTHFWKFTNTWELFAYEGNSPSSKIVLSSGHGQHVLETSVKTSPQPASSVIPSIDLDISWLLHHHPLFKIDRTHKKCHTPRRNKDVDDMFSFMSSLSSFGDRVSRYFTSTLFSINGKHSLDLSQLNDNSIFNPVVALFEEKNNTASSSSSSSSESKSSSASNTGPNLSLSDANAFLAEHKRTIDEKLKNYQTSFPAGAMGGLISVVECKTVLISIVLSRLAANSTYVVDYIESMLRNQLVAAIGRLVNQDDFAQYMIFHLRRLLLPQYAPRGFCHAIRRPNNFPEGILSIETTNGSSNMPEPIQTLCMHSGARPVRPFKFPINSATTITLQGDRYLHAFVLHKFGYQSAAPISLAARAKQFSSFILMVGTIISSDEFDPKYATIIQNKDELVIPLLLETIPTAKEFADAISSLSPEQQRFCKAFRSMQLASTLFGICIIQIKPQMEKVLNLEDESLTKEIQLTQDLQELFITHNISPNLLSFDGKPTASTEAKVAEVKKHVAEINKLIKQAKQAELDEAKLVAEKARAEAAVMFKEYESAPSLEARVPRNRSSAKSMAPSSSCFPMSTASCAPASAPAPSMSVPNTSASSSTPSSTSNNTPSTETKTPVLPTIYDEKSSSSAAAAAGGVVGDASEPDYAAIPNELDSRFNITANDEDFGALRPTIIKAGDYWSKKQHKGLLSPPQTVSQGASEQKTEKNRAFDLLDALTRSGELPVKYASVHVVIASTHCFDSTLIDTVIQGNVNPIEKVERSALIIASTVHNAPAASLLQSDAELTRVKLYSPMLFPPQTAGAITKV